jgi:glycolate oxidase iron-sulfur subunit
MVELLDWATGGPQPPALTAPGKMAPAIPDPRTPLA